MKAPTDPTTHSAATANDALQTELQNLQNYVAAAWHGKEKTAVIEIVRSLDTVNVDRYLTGDFGPKPTHYNRQAHFYASLGAAPALRPFLSKVKGMPGPVPWGRSTPEAARFTYAYLVTCGQLAHLRRMIALERYGFATTTWLAPNQLQIDVRGGLPERAALEAIRSLRPRAKASEAGEADERSKDLWRRMRAYVDTDPRYFIRYDNDSEIVDHYRSQARRYGESYLEGEAFPPDVRIGERTFGEWKEACDQALGRILCHIDFALLLAQKRSKKVTRRDILTLFVRRDDIAAVWLEAGLPKEQLDSTMAALTLTIDDLDAWEQAHEPPAPYYIDLGTHFILLPAFGALNNPYYALFRHLRSVYKSDWDRAVERRESIFRADLRRTFAEPRFLVPSTGFTLRRPDGSTLTDVDAVILDRTRGTLALIQLKWHDIFGLSLAERDSRRRNMSQANEWVARVSSWIDGRSSDEILRALGIPEKGSDRAPVIYVMARYVARFSGGPEPDPRASWLGWPEVLHALDPALAADAPLTALPEIITAQRAKFQDTEDSQETYPFRNLTVNLRVSSS